MATNKHPIFTINVPALFGLQCTCDADPLGTCATHGECVMYNETLADCIAEANEDREHRLAPRIHGLRLANGPMAKWHRAWKVE